MERVEIFETTRAIMGRTFRIDPAGITEATRADDILQWDSLSHLTLVIGLEKRFNTRLPPEPMRLAQDVRRVIDLIEGALAPAASARAGQT